MHAPPLDLGGCLGGFWVGVVGPSGLGLLKTLNTSGPTQGLIGCMGVYGHMRPLGASGLDTGSGD